MLSYGCIHVETIYANVTESEETVYDKSKHNSSCTQFGVQSSKSEAEEHEI